MLNLSERKQQLLKIMDGYQTLLERWADNVRSKDLCSIKSRIESGRYQIALIGSVKRGKSTLLNALLGNAENYALAPVNANTCTSAIVKYLDSALYPGEPGKNGVRVHFNDFRTPNPVFVEDASAYIDQTNRNFKEEYSDKIDFIEIYGNFPLIQTRGIFVDTPGREALHDQDYLSTEILKEVDVIICPIAADLPLDRQEIAFLGNLASLEREKLVFVLTKIDTLNQTELNETFNQIEQTLGEIPDLVRPLRMYKTAAKMVIEAYESNRTAMEIKTIKDSPECGLQEFEDALDGILRKGSQAEKSMGTGCKELEQWLGADKRRLEENMENCTRKSQELEREREELKTFCQKAKDSFEKNAENLRQKWSEEFDNFTDNLNDKADDISSELQREINGLGHLETLKKSLKINREIEKMLKKVLRDELETLNSKLDNLIGKFAKNLESDIDDVFRVHANTFSGKNSLKDVISILLGDIIAAGGTAGGGAIIANALAPIGGVIAPGILAKLGFVFTGSVLAPALFAAIVPVAGGLTLAILATIIGAGLTRNMSEEQVYIIVKKALEEAIEDAKKSSNENLDKTLSRFKEELDSVLSQKLNDLDTVIKAIKEHNQKVKMQEIDSNLAGIKNISEELDRFINQANAG